jgi:hypothetical protein
MRVRAWRELWGKASSSFGHIGLGRLLAVRAGETVFRHQQVIGSSPIAGPKTTHSLRPAGNVIPARYTATHVATLLRFIPTLH